MAILKIKDETGKFVDIPAIQGAPGKDGAIQYSAGKGIKIDGNVISADTENKISVYNCVMDRNQLAGGDFSNIEKTNIGECLSDAYQKGEEMIIINMLIGDTYNNIGIILPYNLQKKPTQINAAVLYSYTTCTYLRINLQWNETGCSVLNGYLKFSQYLEDSNLRRNVLQKNNTSAFTPTGDYHPSTKKYVDDSIAAAITTTLEGEY